MADATANDEKGGDGGEAVNANIEEVKTDGEALKEDSIQDKTDTADDEKDDTAKGVVNVEDNIKDKMDTTDDNKDDSANNEASDSKPPNQKGEGSPEFSSDNELHKRKRTDGGKRYRSNIKTRFDDLPESSDPDDIRRQVEFYFGDSNLPTDAYLLRETGGHANLPIELKVIHNFKRMRHFQPYTAVHDAVKKSNFLNLDDHDMITRRVPLSSKFTDDPYKNKNLVHSADMARSIYAKGFGEEGPSTQLDIEAFFAPYGSFNSIRLRRADDGTFKGSVFVEFVDEETQKRFLQLDPKPQFNSKDLQIMSKMEYVDLKHNGILEGLVKPRGPREHNDRHYKGKAYDRRYERRSHRDRGEMRKKRGSFDKDDWKERRNRDQEDDRDDRRERRSGPGRGRGRGRSDRGGRRRDGDRRRDRSGDRRERRESPDHFDKLAAQHDDKKKQHGKEKNFGGGQEELLTRAEAEFKKGVLEHDAGKEAQAGAGAGAGAEASETMGQVGSQSKKRTREDDGEDGVQGTAKNKKVKSGEVETEQGGAGAEADSKKRSREDDGEDGVQGVAKNKKAKKDEVESEKVESKIEMKKRSREDDAGDGPQGAAKNKKVKKDEVQTEGVAGEVVTKKDRDDAGQAGA